MKSFIFSAILAVSVLAQVVGSSEAQVFSTQGKAIGQFLTNGDSARAVGDYSSTADTFYVQPPLTETWRISRMVVSVEDSSPLVADGAYGAGGIGNGVLVKILSSAANEVVDLTDGVPIQRNFHWTRHGVAAVFDTTGTARYFINYLWDFAESGQEIQLFGADSTRLAVILNDNFGALVEHYFYVQGWNEGESFRD